MPRSSLPLAVFVSVAILAYAAPADLKKKTASRKRHFKKAAGDNKAQPSCTMHEPFDNMQSYGSSSRPHAIDKTCGMTGDATSLGDRHKTNRRIIFVQNQMLLTRSPSTT